VHAGTPAERPELSETNSLTESRLIVTEMVKITHGDRYLWHVGEDLDLLNEAMDRCAYAQMARDEDAKTSIDTVIRERLTSGSEDFKKALTRTMRADSSLLCFTVTPLYW
jgi:hypothetical protein